MLYLWVFKLIFCVFYKPSLVPSLSFPSVISYLIPHWACLLLHHMSSIIVGRTICRHFNRFFSTLRETKPCQRLSSSPSLLDPPVNKNQRISSIHERRHRDWRVICCVHFKGLWEVIAFKSWTFERREALNCATRSNRTKREASDFQNCMFERTLCEKWSKKKN